MLKGIEVATGRARLPPAGQRVWKSGDETMTHATPAFATMGNVRQIVFFAQSGLVSVDAKSGQEYWRTTFPFSNGRVYVRGSVEGA